MANPRHLGSLAAHTRLWQTSAVLGLTLLLILCGITITRGEEVNLALNKTCQIVTGGSLRAVGVKAMVDGDMETMWRTYQAGTPNTLTGIVNCDLGYVSTINRVEIVEYKQKAVNIVVKLSMDGINWNVAAEQDFKNVGSDNRRSEYAIGGQQARYIQVEAKDAVYAFGIYELEVYGIPSEEELAATAAIESLPPLTAPQVVDPIPFTKENFHIYLFIGQSNMSGRDTLGPQDLFVIERTYLFNKEEKWEAAQPWVLPESTYKEMQGLNRYSTVEVLNKLNGLNPATYFATTLVANQPNIAVGIVSNAKGATAISAWLKGTELYEEAVRRAKVAMQYGTLKGIIWQQGEGNRGTVSYVDVLAKLINDFRTDLGIPDLPFIAGEIPYVGDAAKVQGSIDFNTRLSQLPSLVPFTAVVSATGLKDLGDETHIDAAGQRLFGQRFGVRALQLIYGMAESDIKTQFADEPAVSNLARGMLPLLNPHGDLGGGTAACLTDGISTTANGMHDTKWFVNNRSAPAQDAEAVFDFGRPVTISTAVITHGTPQGLDPLVSYKLQYWEEESGSWEDIPGAAVLAPGSEQTFIDLWETENRSSGTSYSYGNGQSRFTFAPITTTKVRFVNTYGAPFRLREIELWGFAASVQQPQQQTADSTESPWARFQGKEDVIVVDFTRELGPATHKGSGILGSVSLTQPADKYIKPLQIYTWHEGFYPAKPYDNNIFALYYRFKDLGVPVVKVGLYHIARENYFHRLDVGLGPVMSDYADWLDYWVDIVGVIVSRAKREGMQVEWAIHSEPNRKIVPNPGPFEFASWADYYHFWDLGVRTIRAIDPDAVIHGPGYAGYNEQELKDFIAHAAAADTMPTYLDWHGGNIGEYPQYAERLRAYAAAHGYQIKITVGEAISVNTDRNLHAGVPVSLFASAERGDLTAVHASWTSQRMAGMPQRWVPLLTGLLTSDTMLPRGVWWSHKAYGDMQGTMVHVDDSHAPNVDGVANKDVIGQTAYVLIGTRDSRDVVRVQSVNPVIIQLKGLEQTPYLLNEYGMVHIQVERIPPTEHELLALPIIYAGDYVVNDEYIVEIPVTLNAGEAIRVTLRAAEDNPRLTRADSDATQVGVYVYELPEQEATALGDTLEYKVHVPTPGWYHIGVGYTGGPQNGVFQVSVDNQPVGGTVDGYSRHPFHSEVPLGNAPYLLAGEHTVQVKVSGKNGASGGAHVALDYLKLTRSLWYEAESLPVTAALDVSQQVVALEQAGGGQYVLADLSAPAGYVEYGVLIPEPGLYHVQLGALTGASGGAFTLEIADETTPPGREWRSKPLDTYAAQPQLKVMDAGYVTFSAPGWKRFRLRSYAENALSADQSVAIDYLSVQPSQLSLLYEADTLQYAISPGRSVTTVKHNNNAHANYRLAQLQAVGEYVEYVLPVTESGQYLLWLRHQGHAGGGRFEVYVNGRRMVGPIDNYGDALIDVPIGVVHLTTESITKVRLQVVGKSSESSGYGIGVDTFRITKVTGEPLVYEVEQLPALISPQGSVRTMQDAQAGGGAYQVATLQQLDDYIEYTLDIPEPGTYHVEVGYLKEYNDRATFGLMIEEAQQDAHRNLYTVAADTIQSRYVNHNSLNSWFHSKVFETAGEKRFRFFVNRLNQGYNSVQIPIDYIKLIRLADDLGYNPQSHIAADAVNVRLTPFLQGMRLSGPQSVEVEITSEATASLERVDVYMDGVLWLTQDKPKFTLLLNQGELGDGAHELRIAAVTTGAATTRIYRFRGGEYDTCGSTGCECGKRRHGLNGYIGFTG
ncbi:MAG: sialate O-acetylesterase [Limnochordia bacterium]